ncbi:Swi5 family protein [Candida albicans]|uniref:Swi5 family protein n=1 Tax=Candida albicans TaxID=5476 RepID=A0A8H6F0Q6_CANAX|nr:Swi5 family protein [Candida albicans]
MMSAKTDIPNTSSTSPSPSPTTANSTVTTVTTSSPISESKPRRLLLSKLITITPEDDIQQKLLLKEQSLNDIKLQCSRLIYELEGNNEPELIIQKYIQDLNKYNELKDLALQLITLIADQRKVKTSDILQEMNIEINNNE